MAAKADPLLDALMHKEDHQPHAKDILVRYLVLATKWSCHKLISDEEPYDFEVVIR
jgi:hypothetical protein